jgi:hypothetical protein
MSDCQAVLLPCLAAALLISAVSATEDKQAALLVHEPLWRRYWGTLQVSCRLGALVIRVVLVCTSPLRRQPALWMPSQDVCLHVAGVHQQRRQTCCVL